jgi:hypothetical protein
MHSITFYRNSKGKFTLQPAMKVQKLSRRIALLLFNIGARWGAGAGGGGLAGQRHSPAALRLGKRPGTHFTGGWVGPRTGLDGCGKSRLRRDSIPNFQRVAILTTLIRATVKNYT